MGKATIIILRFIVFFVVFAGVIIAINYLMSEFPFFAAHDAGADVKVWQDTNGDGKLDHGEPPLSDVCIWAGYASSHESLRSWQEKCKNQYFLTDSNGTWSDFFAGGSCEEIYITANPPAGYRPTTPLVVNNCVAEFGFAPRDGTSEMTQPDVRAYLKKMSEKETVAHWLKLGMGIALISAFAGFVSVQVIRPVKAKAG